MLQDQYRKVTRKGMEEIMDMVKDNALARLGNSPHINPDADYDDYYTSSNMGIDTSRMTFENLMETLESITEMREKNAREMCEAMDFPYDEDGIYVIDWGPGEETEMFRGPVDFFSRMSGCLVRKKTLNQYFDDIEEAGMEVKVGKLLETVTMYYVDPSETDIDILSDIETDLGPE